MILELIFYMGTPIITNSEINIDSLFCGVSPANHNKDHFVNRQTKSGELNALPIPIDCAKLDGRYIYCSSCADFTDHKMITETATKRRNGEDVLYYHTMLTPRTGIDKDCMLKLYGVSCSSVSFLLSSAYPNEVDRYARRIKNIGGMRKQGYGHVRDFEIIERADLDWKDCIVQNGRALRNIPQSFLKNDVKSMLRCSPPYWMRDGIEPCAAVGDIAELKEDVYLSCFRK